VYLEPIKPLELGDCTFHEEVITLLQSPPLPEVQFLNVYKEVPVSGPAQYLHTSDDKLFYRTNDVQSRVIELSNYTVIKAPKLKHDVYAAAHYNPETKEVALSNFSYVDVLSHKRSSIRVRMHVPLEVMIMAGPNNIKGRLLDISLDGCAIAVTKTDLLSKFVYFTLILDVPQKTGKASMNARVMARLIKKVEASNFYRCVFLFGHDKRSEDQIGNLVAQRQAEIIRELK
jgi:hypothetical protein